MPLKRAPCASMVHVWTFSALYDVKNMKLAAKSILILHVFTGSNAKSVFGNKGKVKPLKILLKTIHYINISANNGVGASLKNYRLNFLQQFLCDLYCHKQGRLETKNIPLCLDSLKLHASRNTYQSWDEIILLQSLSSFYSWPWVEDERRISFNQVKYCQAITQRDFGTYVLYLLQKLCSKIILLHSKGLLCSDTCTKLDCNNYYDVDIATGQDYEYHSDKDYYQEIWYFDGLKSLYINSYVKIHCF